MRSPASSSPPFSHTLLTQMTMMEMIRSIADYSRELGDWFQLQALEGKKMKGRNVFDGGEWSFLATHSKVYLMRRRLDSCEGGQVGYQQRNLEREKQTLGRPKAIGREAILLKWPMEVKIIRHEKEHAKLGGNFVGRQDVRAKACESKGGKVENPQRNAVGISLFFTRESCGVFETCLI
ncbi:hypothetical protein KFK09_019754 [Dendrobium nobile]|uniref:Uncharacterized protein n=1 Tax=Dendrobium nobile TaxID=94219 RepID=A0A8T3ARW0_DENNO|nr:hypothetical protein KFK09_019754 [Dendrobium nobile]